MRIQTSSPTAAVNDQQARAVAQAVLRTFQLSAQKAALHHADPRRFPVQQGVNSVENTLIPLFKELPAAQQQATKSQALASVNTPAAQRAAAVAVSAGVNFESPAPVAEQLRESAQAVVAPVPSAQRVIGEQRIIGENGDWPRRGDRDDWPPVKDEDEPPPGKLPLKRSVLALHSLKAVKDTKEWGKDEIKLGATAVIVTTVDGKPVPSKGIIVEPFKVGSFKKGETKLLRDKVLYAFSPPEHAQYPLGYAVTLMLVEEDHGKRETLRKALKSIEDAVIKEITKWAKELPGLLKNLAELVLKILPPLLAKVFDAIANWLGDDIFDPSTISISINSPDSRLPNNVTPRETVSLLMKGGRNARYDLTYSWHVFA